MLTNSKEYQELKKKVASFLNINTNDIYDIDNPLKNKKTRKVYLVSLLNGKTYMLHEKDGFLKQLN